jgi:hypothetical protein
MKMSLILEITSILFILKISDVFIKNFRLKTLRNRFYAQRNLHRNRIIELFYFVIDIKFFSLDIKL